VHFTVGTGVKEHEGKLASGKKRDRNTAGFVLCLTYASCLSIRSFGAVLSWIGVVYSDQRTVAGRDMIGQIRIDLDEQNSET
jgi:hypothetical protein